MTNSEMEKIRKVGRNVQTRQESDEGSPTEERSKGKVRIHPKEVTNQ